MGKKDKVKVEGNTITINADNVKDALDALTQPKPYEITSASLKEDLCNYGYEIKTGPTAGDKIPTRKGSAVVHDDMRNAFGELNVHLAILDDAFVASSSTLEDLVDNSTTENFTVFGFDIQGNEENEGFVLVGEKVVHHGVINLKSPKITVSSGYKFFEELKGSVEKCRNEVELYMNGKAAPKDAEQPELPFATSASEFDENE